MKKGVRRTFNLDPQTGQNESILEKKDKKNSKIMTRARIGFWEPPRNNCRMAFGIKLRCRCSSLQATRRNSLLWAISIIHLPIHNLLAFQTSSCAVLHRLSFSSPAPASAKDIIIYSRESEEQKTKTKMRVNNICSMTTKFQAQVTPFKKRKHTVGAGEREREENINENYQNSQVSSECSDKQSNSFYRNRTHHQKGKVII